jgi:hypothetical protein
MAQKWVKKLCLTEWEIDFVFLPWEEMEGTVGRCHWQTEYHKATVQILDPATCPGEDVVPYDASDIEQTLVHELLHIVIQGRSNIMPKYNANFERALNILSEVLAPKKEKRGRAKRT